MKRFRALVWVLSPKVAFLYWCNFDALVQLIRLFLLRKCRKWRWRWPVITGCGKNIQRLCLKIYFTNFWAKISTHLDTFLWKKPREYLTPPKAKNDWPKIFIVLKFKSWLPVINYAKSQMRQNLLALELNEFFSTITNT